MFYEATIRITHQLSIAQEWVLYNCRKVILTPAQSADLNIIEQVLHELRR
ncbi:hypothetical protein WN55_02121 [Dufourea novaeangliae]|uniref:Uncharacterized protein n=1 Tax=Dufourea novaeangliae TaxID=178035 RepID=A0A154NXE0_DUFNO|nr:hypothetical protein WN55_02121 [Dufourea novaeangliae]